MFIKNVRHKRPMSVQPLTGKYIAHSLFLFGHITYVISLCIENDVLIRLLKSTAT